jgi:pimeloyl-ACP methyl ester carboxylesterase
MNLITRTLLVATLPCALGFTTALQDRYFVSAGVPIRYVEAGAGEPVVLVHGYTSNIEEQWMATGVFARLSQHYRVIAFDARGHGKSGKPHDPAEYGPEMARDVVRLLDHLDLPQAHIVGYSMGAHIVAQLLTMSPQRFITATLGGASGRRNWTAEDERRVEVEAAEMEKGELASQILRLRPPGDPAPSPDEIAALSAKILTGRDPRALAAVRRSNRDQVVTEVQMASVRVPTLGIVGSDDPYLADFRALARVMPQLELVVIDGATHGSAPAHPELTRAMLAFLAAAKQSRKKVNTVPFRLELARQAEPPWIGAFSRPVASCAAARA